MSNPNKPPAEAAPGFRQELHHVGIDINKLLSESEFHDSSRQATDKSGIEHEVASTSPANPQGFAYIVERRFPEEVPHSRKRTWFRALQEDPERQIVEEIIDGIVQSVRKGFDDDDMAEIRESVEVIKKAPDG